MSKSGSIARVFITGSSDGLGLLTGKQLARDGHKVVLHARDLFRGLGEACRAMVQGRDGEMPGVRSRFCQTTVGHQLFTAVASGPKPFGNHVANSWRNPTRRWASCFMRVITI